MFFDKTYLCKAMYMFQESNIQKIKVSTTKNLINLLPQEWRGQVLIGGGSERRIPRDRSVAAT